MKRILRLFTLMSVVLAFSWTNASAVSLSFSNGVATLDFDGEGPEMIDQWGNITNEFNNSGWGSINNNNLTKLIIKGTVPTDNRDKIFGKIKEKFDQNKRTQTLDMSLMNGMTLDELKNTQLCAAKIILPKGMSLPDEDTYVASQSNGYNPKWASKGYICALDESGSTVTIAGQKFDNRNGESVIANDLGYDPSTQTIDQTQTVYPFSNATSIVLVPGIEGNGNDANYTSTDVSAIEKFNAASAVTTYENGVLTLAEGDDTQETLPGKVQELHASDADKVVFPDGSVWEKSTGKLTATANAEAHAAALGAAGFHVSSTSTVQKLGKYVSIVDGVTIVNIPEGESATAFPTDNIDSSGLSEEERTAVKNATDLKLVGEISNNGWDVLKNKAGTTSTPVQYITGYEERPVQQKDENGDPIFENGQPVYEAVWVQQYDNQGNAVYDEEGNPVYVKKTDAQGNIVYVTETVPTYSTPASYVHNLDLSEAILQDSHCKLTNNFAHVESVKLPTDANYKNIPEGFATSTQLQTIVIPNNVETIGKSAFAGCGRLTTVSWAQDGNLKRFEESAFENCNITGDLVFPPSVEYIGPKAFKNSLNISSVTFPQGSHLWGEGHGIMAEAFWMDGKENALKNVYVLDTQHLINCDVMAFDYDNTDGQTQMNTVKTRLHYPPELYYYYVGEWKARVNGGIIAGHNDLLALRNIIENADPNKSNPTYTEQLHDPETGANVIFEMVHTGEGIPNEALWVNGFQKFVSSGIPVTFDTQWRTYSDVVPIRVPKANDKVADVYIVCGYDSEKGVLLKQMKEDDIIPAQTGIVIHHYVSEQAGNGLLTFRHVTQSTLTSQEAADPRVFDRYCYVVEDQSIFVDQRATYHEDAHENTTGIHTRLYKPTGESLSGEFADGYPNYLEFIDCKGKERVVYNAENNNIVNWPILEMDNYTGQKVTYRNFVFGNGKLIQHAKDEYDAWKADPDNHPNPNKYGDYTGRDWKPNKEGKMDWGFFRCVSGLYKVNSKAFLHFPAFVFTQANGGSHHAIINGEIISGAKSMGLFVFEDNEPQIATGINDSSIQSSSINEVYYTLQGLKVAKPSKSGVYIHNGKKVVIR